MRVRKGGGKETSWIPKKRDCLVKVTECKHVELNSAGSPFPTKHSKCSCFILNGRQPVCAFIGTIERIRISSHCEEIPAFV